MPSRLEQLCLDKGLKMTEQRRSSPACVGIDRSSRCRERSTAARPRSTKISIATVYRTVRLFEEANILARHHFGDGPARYEEMPARPSRSPDRSPKRPGGRVPRRGDREAPTRVARRLGYRLVDHRLELYAVRDEEPPSLRRNEGSPRDAVSNLRYCGCARRVRRRPVEVGRARSRRAWPRPAPTSTRRRRCATACFTTRWGRIRRRDGADAARF